MAAHGSKAALRLYSALKLLGSYEILQEYDVGERLRVDYVIKNLRAGFEIDGRQHTEFVAHFHGTKDAFRAAQQRDRRKEQLCEEQGIRLIRFDEKTIMNAASPRALLALVLERLNGSEEETSEEDGW